MNLDLAKDILYLIGSVLGIVGFIRTLKKRDKCEFSYRTEFGDEANPFLICIRGDIFNLSVSSKDESIWASKYPHNTNLSQVKYKNVDDAVIDKSTFFPLLKEGDIISISNDNLDMPLVFLRYEDKFHNRYYQTFSFDAPQIRSVERKINKSKSCYILSKRYWRFCCIWFPLWKHKY